MTHEQLLLLANVVSFIGNALFTISIVIKTKKKILALQTFNDILSGFAHFCIDAFSGMFINIVMFIRNLLFVFIDEDKRFQRGLVYIATIISVITGGILMNIVWDSGVWYGYLPVIGVGLSSVLYFVMFLLKNLTKTEKEIIFRVTLIINCSLWLAYGLFIKLYPTVIFNAVAILISITLLVKMCIIHIKNKRKEE